MTLNTIKTLGICLLILSCSKGKSNPGTPEPTPPDNPPPAFSFSVLKVDGVNNNTFSFFNTSLKPVVEASFSGLVDKSSVSSGFFLVDKGGARIAVDYTYGQQDSIVKMVPQGDLVPLSQYTVQLTAGLKSALGANLQSPVTALLITQIDSMAKYPTLSDDALLDLVQKQTLKYFWDYGHPVSGLARERSNGDDDVVTTGGSGFGIMAMIAAANRGFISRADALQRIQTITDFLINKCERWHGAFSHWINGSTGATVAFGKNNGADIVETSFLVQGLLTARQYFNDPNDEGETELRNKINSIWQAVDWNWFTQNGTTNSLYWQYNPDYTNTSDIWSIPVTGWNESLITYVLAASSPDHGIAKDVYDIGWAQNGGMANGNTFFNITLPLGPNLGGPLFFSHYSFLGLNPKKISDKYADYWTQNTAQSQINYQYCVRNQGGFFGYSNLCWGLTASDDPNGYDAHSPTNDNGTISPTAAISSLPYTPESSMAALRFFYYQMGDELWGEYGFIDAFNLSKLWFADSFLAIDQGPQIVMIENYRSGLLWNLFMSCPEVQSGLSKLGFTIQ